MNMLEDHVSAAMDWAGTVEGLLDALNGIVTIPMVGGSDEPA